jgi:hypothetical protein
MRNCAGGRGVQGAKGGFWALQQVTSVPSLPIHNRFACLSVDELNEDSCDTNKPIKDAPTPPKPHVKLHQKLWE